MLRFLLGKADAERRAALTVLVAMRWVLIAAALFQVNYRPGSEREEYALLNALIVFAAVLNGILQAALAGRREISLWFPVAVGFYDVVAVTGAIATVDGFDNPSFLLYYPALLSFVLVFPGKWSFVYTAAVMGAYILSAVVLGDRFDGSSASDQKALVLRLLTLATASLMANLVVRLERRRRELAVEAAEERTREALAAEQRALDAERRIEEERGRLSREIHDGVSQRVYMLGLGLENARVAAERQGQNEMAERLRTLHGVSRETLLETRNLLFDLGRVMSGEERLEELIRNQAREFSAVTGIPVTVQDDGGEGTLAPHAVAEVFRVVQEALANVMKHSEAGSVRVNLARGGGRMRLLIEDDGHGFVLAEGSNGHGLANMRERARLLDGELSIATQPGKGTRLELSIPVGASR